MSTPFRFDPDLPPVIRVAAMTAGLQPELLAAIVWQESRGDRHATRYESAYRWLWDVYDGKPFRRLTADERFRPTPPSDFRGPTGATAPKEWLGQRTSWGLCLAEGTAVATERGWMPIESVLDGTRVLDRHGNLETVVASASRVAECFSVKVGLNAPLVATAGHPVFARKSTFGTHRTGRRKVVTADAPEWIEVSELREWDMLAFPRTGKVEDVETLRLVDLLAREQGWRDACEYAEEGTDLILRYRSGGRERARVHREVPVNEALLELVGLYVAEGNRLDKEKGLAFSFHERETHLHARVLSLFKSVFGPDPSYAIHRKPEDHAVQVCVYGPAARWLGRLVPGTARTKALPGWMLWLPPMKQAALVRGMWLGDGCLSRGHYTTASESLAYAMAHMLSRLGIVARITPCRTWFNVGLNSHDGVATFATATGLEVGWPQTADGRERHTSVSWRSDADFIYFPVRSVEAVGERRVFDLQVPADSSFVAGRTVVHNCQVMGATARQLGFQGVDFEELFDPATNLTLGARLLAKLTAKWELADAISAYNAGSPTEANDEKYVRPVMRQMAAFEKDGF